jgi:hypothetical protein
LVNLLSPITDYKSQEEAQQFGQIVPVKSTIARDCERQQGWTPRRYY